MDTGNYTVTWTRTDVVVYRATISATDLFLLAHDNRDLPEIIANGPGHLVDFETPPNRLNHPHTLPLRTIITAELQLEENDHDGAH